MSKNKIKSLSQLQKSVAACKKRGEKVVFTNGCFDLLHLGHIKYLQRAKKLGEKLVVAVNSDSSVRKIKGKGRPVTPQLQRAILLAALEDVDFVTIFSATTPQRLIQALKPDVLVKGGDWLKSEIVGRQFVESYGGKVVSLKFVPGHSTTCLINRIKKLK